MSAHYTAIPKKRKLRANYDGSDGISRGRQSGISGLLIAKPFIHPLNMAASLEVAAPGRRTKRPRFDNISRSQFPAYEEKVMREAAARKAGKHDLTCVST